jgi:DNA-binding beta-propeller fold protein YncE
VTVAGTGDHKLLDGPALTTAAFYHPIGVAAHPSKGRLFVADTPTHVVRKIDVEAKTVTTLVGTGHETPLLDGVKGTAATLSLPTALCVDPATGHLFIGDAGNSRVRKLHADTNIVETVAGCGHGYVDGAASVAKYAGSTHTALSALCRDVH